LLLHPMYVVTMYSELRKLIDSWNKARELNIPEI
jgi:hypothetical protein